MADKPTRLIRRIAIVGGTSYDDSALLKFLSNLKEKYPTATLLIGDGRGAEAVAIQHAKLMGFEIETPPLHEEWYGKEAGLCQVNDLLLTADAVVIVGVKTGQRAKRALDILKRVDTHRDCPRAVHHVGVPAKKAKAA